MVMEHNSMGVTRIILVGRPPNLVERTAYWSHSRDDKVVGQLHTWLGTKPKKKGFLFKIFRFRSALLNTVYIKIPYLAMVPVT